MSIRLRLTLWYSALLAAMLILFSVLLYGIVAFRLNADLDRELDIRREQLDTAIKDQLAREPFLLQRPGRVIVIIQQNLDIFSSQNIAVQAVRADNGAVVDTSANLGDQQLPHDADLLATARGGRSTLSTFTNANRARFRMLTAPIIIAGAPRLIVQVAGSLQNMDRTLNLLAFVLATGTIAAVGFAALIGFALAGSALKPIDAITRAARAIAQTKDLEKRVRETRNADEVDRLAITFNEMLQRLENLFRTQQQFLADVSHELRTPLTIIRGNLSLLHKSSAHADQEAIQTIDDEAQRMSRLIADLLLLAQSDAGAATVQREPVEMDTLLLDVYRQARVMAAPRDGQLQIVLGEEDQAIVEGDPDRLKQLVLNLVENAIKYTPSGEIKLALRKKNGQVGISVSDTGPGISPADVPHLFERFYRADKARSRDPSAHALHPAGQAGSGGGTGLGLSIADWVAKAHGGYIDVQSELGKGSTFTVWLPEKK